MKERFETLTHFYDPFFKKFVYVSDFKKVSKFKTIPKFSKRNISIFNPFSNYSVKKNMMTWHYFWNKIKKWYHQTWIKIHVDTTKISSCKICPNFNLSSLKNWVLFTECNQRIFILYVHGSGEKPKTFDTYVENMLNNAVRRQGYNVSKSACH